MFIHHVFFWLKEPGNPAAQQLLQQGIESLLTIKPHVLAHVGKPAGTNRGVIDSSYTFSLLLGFETAADEAAYQAHPTHDKFRNEYAHLWEKVVVYDSVD